MPNRILKDTIRTSKSVNALTDFQFRVWAYLITYVDDYGRGSADAELLKGLVFPRRKGVTERQIEDALSVLANMGMITLYTVDDESYLYFPKWEKHQQVRSKRSRFPEPQENLQAHDIKCNHMISDDCICPRNPIQYNTNPNTESESNARARGDDFEAFWRVYPKKVGKADAIKKFAKALQKVSLETLLNAVEEQKTCAQWQKDGGQYIPNPSTWLHQERWNDDIKPANAAKTFLDLYYEEGGE